MDFLWSLFEPLVHLLEHMVEFMYRLTALAGVPSYGAAIILMTVVIKMLLYPLTVKQVKSMKAMQVLQPQMKRLQEQYKTNPQLLQQEMQKLYQEAGVNPLAGCLPMLVQMPILMAIFYALKDATYAGGNPAFLWMPSLSEADPYYVLPVLSALSTYLTTRQTTDESNQQMKMMMYVMPLVIGWMSMNFASGLVIYWITMNLVQVAQQWFIFREEKGPELPKEDKRKKKEKKEK